MSAVRNAIRSWRLGRVVLVWLSGAILAVALLGCLGVTAARRDALDGILRHWPNNPFLTLEDDAFREGLYRFAPNSVRLWAVDSVGATLSTNSDDVERRSVVWRTLERQRALLSATMIALVGLAAIVFPITPIAANWIWLGRDPGEA